MHPVVRTRDVSCALTTVVCHLCDYGALTNSLAESDMDHDHIMVQTTVQFWNLAIRTVLYTTYKYIHMRM